MYPQTPGKGLRMLKDAESESIGDDSQTTSKCGEMPHRQDLKNYGVSDIGEHPMEISNTNWRKYEKVKFCGIRSRISVPNHP